MYAVCENCGYIIESEVCEFCYTDHNIKIMTKSEFKKMIGSLPPMRLDLKKIVIAKDFPVIRGMIWQGRYCGNPLYVRYA